MRKKTTISTTLVLAIYRVALRVELPWTPNEKPWVMNNTAYSIEQNGDNGYRISQA
jgi:hypothetical protein